MALVKNNPLLALDVSEVGSRETRDQLTAALGSLGCSYRAYSGFWDRFPGRPHRLPRRVMVVADLARIARHYKNVSDQHSWIASVRKARVFFLAFVRTKEDEHVADLVDDLVRHSDSRIAVCRSLLASEMRACLFSALSAFNPYSLASVRYSPVRNGIGVEFADGLYGFIDWSAIGIADMLDDLVLESATVGSKGRTLELSRKGGDLFEIDSTSLRALLDSQLQTSLRTAQTRAFVAVGQRIRETRQRSGLTQEALGAKTGIDQALLSKMERGLHQPRFDTLQRVAQAFGLTVSALVGGSSLNAEPPA